MIDSPSSGLVRLEAHAALPDVAVLTLSNPARLNAITIAMWRQLRELAAQLHADARLRCVIVRGEDGHFAAGGDIAEMQGFRFEPARLREFHEEIVAPALHALLGCEVPLVAQIDGHCIGGGLEVAACCDLRVCAADSRFGAPIARLGFPMAPGELEIVLGVLGAATAAEMLLEARLLDAATALQRGLVHRVVPAGEVAAEAQASAARIAAGAPHAARLNKRTLQLLRRPGGPTPAERAALFDYAPCADHREGVNAFLQKRAPRFSGA
ncbi:enoyl-CoA hydratase/isomerase family protein [Caldimonas tepidiphila]|uniref:enoyl-CoA hydratase/isomerase family protein n=1 Tax=Caldimonas tepidiphila TaxID=2315841 RepID=UPI000E5BD0E3|nr:enoyl-CoA hydratase/isomerase family protein [Caldimonas tepidiphila]